MRSVLLLFALVNVKYFNEIREIGKKIVTEKEVGKERGTFVPDLLALKDKYSTIMVDAFRGDKRFIHALNQVLINNCMMIDAS